MVVMERGAPERGDRIGTGQRVDLVSAVMGMVCFLRFL